MRPVAVKAGVPPSGASAGAASPTSQGGSEVKASGTRDRARAGPYTHRAASVAAVVAAEEADEAPPAARAVVSTSGRAAPCLRMASPTPARPTA